MYFDEKTLVNKNTRVKTLIILPKLTGVMVSASRVSSSLKKNLSQNQEKQKQNLYHAIRMNFLID